MEPITTRDRIRHVHSRWHEQYYFPGREDKWLSEDKRVIHEALCALDKETATAADVEAIIGNTSWTDIRCQECEKLVWEAVVLNAGDEYHEFVICEACSAQAFALLNASTWE